MKRSFCLICCLLLSVLLGCRGEDPQQSALDQAMAEAEPHLRVSKLVNLAITQQQAKNSDQAKQTLATAAEEAAKITDPIPLASAWNEIAFTQADVGDTDGAKAAVAQAIAATGQITRPERRAAETAQSAFAYQRLGDEAQVIALLDQAEELARSAETPFGKVSSLLAVTFWSIPAKQNDRAERLIEEIGQLTTQFEQPPGQQAAVDAIKLKLDRVNRFHRAQSEFSDLVVVAHHLDKTQYDANALVNIASQLIDIGFSEDARWLLDKAEVMAAEIEDEGSKVETLGDIETERKRLS